MKIIFIVMIILLVIVPIIYCLKRRRVFYNASNNSDRKEYAIYFQHGANEYLRLAIHGFYTLAIAISIITFN